MEFKEQRRLWFQDLLTEAGTRDPDGLSTQLMLLGDGAIAAALVRKYLTVAGCPMRKNKRVISINVSALLTCLVSMSKRSLEWYASERPVSDACGKWTSMILS
jgi:hypothetical protein